jgi:hypothetical protein
MALTGASAAHAITVHNQTQHFVSINQVTVGSWTVASLAPNASASCSVGSNACNPSGNPAELSDIEIVTTTGPNYFARVEVRADGVVYITQPLHSAPLFPWTPSDILVESYNPTGGLIDTTIWGGADANPETRDLQFLAGGDPQYWNSEGPDGPPRNAVADDVAVRIRQEFSENPKLRGLVMAGDLTQNALRSTEYKWYLDSWITPNRPWEVDLTHYIYDGLGNHDYGTQGELIRQELRSRNRNTVRAEWRSTGVPFYSWDWHDVHFVQLNLQASDGPREPNVGWEDPGPALTFLMEDLAEHVGDTGRPVVIIHHYGLDCFSAYTWSESQRLAYWNAIQPYNVALILTGHNHRTPDINSWFWWCGPAYPVADDQCNFTVCQYNDITIDTVNVSATHLNKYTDCRLGAHNLSAIDVKDEMGVVWKRLRLLKGKAIFVNAAAPRQGDGSPKYPWRTIQGAASAVSAIHDEIDGVPSDQLNFQDGLQMKITAGIYPGGAVFNSPVEITSTGGTAHLGG